MKNLFGLVLAMVLVASQSASADLIVYWNFNNLSNPSGGVPSNANQLVYAPSQGSGSLNLVGWTSRGGTTAPHGISNFTGSILNSIVPDPAGQALALQGGTTSGTPNNGASLVMSFSMTGFANPVLTFATQRTSTGFNSNSVSYSTDGINYTNWAGGLGPPYNPALAYSVQTFDFSSQNALDGAATAFIRITFNGASASAGNNRLDNIQINAISTIPEPSSGILLSMVGLGLVGFRRRRT